MADLYNEYYTTFREKELLLQVTTRLYLSVKGKKPDTKNICCMKFKTGKTNPGGNAGKKVHEEDFCVADNVLYLDLGNSYTGMLTCKKLLSYLHT